MHQKLVANSNRKLPRSRKETQLKSYEKSREFIAAFVRPWNVVLVVLDFTTLLTSQVISVAFYNEREKSDKFSSEALISAWGYFTCRKSTTRDLRLYFPSEGNHTKDFYALKKKNHRTSDPVASMITMGPPRSTPWNDKPRRSPTHRLQLICEEYTVAIWRLLHQAILTLRSQELAVKTLRWLPVNHHTQLCKGE